MGTLKSDNDGGEAFTFDSVISEAYTETANVTEHPIDIRGSVTDHIQTLNRKFSVEAIVTATPFDDQSSDERQAAAIEAALEGGGVVEQAATGIQRMVEAVEFLRQNQTNTYTWIGAKLGTVENVVVSSFEYTVDNVDRLLFTLDCVQVRFGHAKIVDLPPVVIVPPKAKPIRECGVQPTRGDDGDDGDGTDGDRNFEPKYQSFLNRGGEALAEKKGIKGGLGGWMDNVEEQSREEIEQ